MESSAKPLDSVGNPLKQVDNKRALLMQREQLQEKLLITESVCKRLKKEIKAIDEELLDILKSEKDMPLLEAMESGL